MHHILLNIMCRIAIINNTTKMNEDSDQDDKMGRFIQDNYDSNYAKGKGENHYLNPTVERYTDISNGLAVSPHMSDVDASPSPFKYRDNNLGDLSPFGGMRRRPFS